MNPGTPYVLSMGEALVDMLETWLEEERIYVPAPGGSPLNVATGLVRLGVACEFVSAFGRDPLGNGLRSFLDGEGVRLSASVSTSRPTSIAMTSFDGAEPHFVFYGTPASYGDIDADGLPPALVAGARVVHAGSIGLLEPRMYRAAVNAFAVDGPLRTVDPNVRLSLIDDLEVYRRDMEVLFSRAHLVKLSSVDAAGMYPDLDHDEVLEHLAGLGVPIVVLTLGEAGLRCRRDGVDTHVPGRVVDAVDTTGAGDSCMAGMLRGLVLHGIDADEATWQAVLESAVDVAAWTCQRSGGSSAMPRRDDVASTNANLGVRAAAPTEPSTTHA